MTTTHAPTSARAVRRSPRPPVARSRAAGALLLLLAAMASEARACAVCFGAPGSEETRAITWAVLFMLGVLACVLTGVVAFMIQLARRARRPLPAHLALANQVLQENAPR